MIIYLKITNERKTGLPHNNTSVGKFEGNREGILQKFRLSIRQPGLRFLFLMNK